MQNALPINEDGAPCGRKAARKAPVAAKAAAQKKVPVKPKPQEVIEISPDAEEKGQSLDKKKGREGSRKNVETMTNILTARSKAISFIIQGNFFLYILKFFFFTPFIGF